MRVRDVVENYLKLLVVAHIVLAGESLYFTFAPLDTFAVWIHRSDVDLWVYRQTKRLLAVGQNNRVEFSYSEWPNLLLLYL